MLRTDSIISGRECSIFKNGPKATSACIFCGIGSAAESGRDEADEIARRLCALCGEYSWTLVLFKVDNWNRDFSPWAAPAVYGEEPFVGKAGDTLHWVLNEAIPALHLDNGCKKYIAGYSLSGLFALWGCLESEAFDGAASCSGSLWFPGWMDYLQDHLPSQTAAVYLSLGTKEEKTKNAAMSVIGDNTRGTYAALKKQSCVKNIILEWNKGGHFSNPTERLVKGIAWLLKNGAPPTYK